MNYYTEAFRKYGEFSGRASRAEYWYFFLFNFVIAGVLGAIEGPDTSAISGIYRLIILIPSIAVAVRRMHDVNKSGWFIIIPFYNLILAPSKGTAGDNKYGPSSGKAKYEENNTKNVTSVESSKYCNRCGKSIDADSKFCTNCGNKVS